MTNKLTLANLLTAVIAICVVVFAWLVYSSWLLPYQQANVALENKHCLQTQPVCFLYPKSWQILTETESNYETSVVKSKDNQQYLSISAGELKRAKLCDPREKRPLYIIAAEPAEVSTKLRSSRPVYAVKAVVETAADGLYVPTMYLTTDKNHQETGQLEVCNSNDADIISSNNAEDMLITSGIDSAGQHIGSVAPDFRSREVAEDWLQSPSARVAYRVLKTVEYQ